MYNEYGKDHGGNDVSSVHSRAFKCYKWDQHDVTRPVRRMRFCEEKRDRKKERKDIVFHSNMFIVYYSVYLKPKFCQKRNSHAKCIATAPP